MGGRCGNWAVSEDPYRSYCPTCGDSQVSSIPPRSRPRKDPIHTLRHRRAVELHYSSCSARPCLAAETQCPAVTTLDTTIEPAQQ